MQTDLEGKKVRTQSDKRKHAIYTDQHGRRWSCAVHVDTDEPVETPLLYKHPHNPPWLPAPKYLRFNSAERRMYIDYPAIFADCVLAVAPWNDRLRDIALQRYGEKAHEAVASPPPEVLAILGSKPRDLEFAQAAAAGDKWVLGWTDVVPPKAQALLDARPKERHIPLEPEDEGTDTWGAEELDVVNPFAMDGADPAVDAAVDMDETYDPDARGGKRVRVGKRG